MTVTYGKKAVLKVLLEQKNDTLDPDGVVSSTTKTWICRLSIFYFHKRSVKN